jgi:hypothetical protein
MNKISYTKLQSLFNNLKKICGASALILSMWTALITLASVHRSVIILLYADGYHETTYTIDRLIFQKGEMRRNRTYDSYGAEGTVEGQEEFFGLGEYVHGVLQKREDLEAQVHVGQKLKVLYNPDVPRTSGLRVLYPEKNLKESWKRIQTKMIRTGYGPWLISMILCLLFGIAAGKTISSIKICIGALVFVLLSWIPFLIQIVN